FEGNWKMNHGPSEARAFMRAFLERYAARRDRTVVLFPPALALAAVRDELETAGRDDVLLGVQNVHSAPKGPFCGEISAPMARDAGASWCLVGHSERRHVFGESDAETAEKVKIALASGLVPVLCVGEKLEERERGETESVVLRQLEAGVSAVESAAVGGIVVAYEPVWAIGTGKTATPDDAAAVHRVIRRDLAARIGARAAEVPILYGGSVNRANAAALLGAENVDGLLVGGASLDPEEWAAICAT
ncbi:MAG TPA: triose-phosphate isomerase, partial [Gemmatimonadaceae bacterium]|nr:triose-phosphate isomerase [Gemmatimonadaceae bacterium]